MYNINEINRNFQVFSGTIKLRGGEDKQAKAPAYPVKNPDGTTQLYLGAKLVKATQADSSIGAVLKEGFCFVDIDDSTEAEIVFNLCKKLQWKCFVIKTTRGHHFYFRYNNKPKEEPLKDGSDLLSPIGIRYDFKTPTGKRHPDGTPHICYAVTRLNGKTRPVVYATDEIEELPEYFRHPLNIKKIGADGRQRGDTFEIKKLYTMRDGDGRHMYLFTTWRNLLLNNDFTPEEMIRTINFINWNILAEPLTQTEIDNITNPYYIRRSDRPQSLFIHNSTGTSNIKACYNQNEYKFFNEGEGDEETRALIYSTDADESQPPAPAPAPAQTTADALKTTPQQRALNQSINKKIYSNFSNITSQNEATAPARVVEATPLNLEAKASKTDLLKTTAQKLIEKYYFKVVKNTRGAGQLYYYENSIYHFFDKQEVYARALKINPELKIRDMEQITAYLYSFSPTLSKEATAGCYAIATQDKYLIIKERGEIEIIEPTPDIFVLHRINACYNGKKDMATINKFLKEIANDDSEVETLLKELICYTILPANILQKGFFLQGTGSNGKSVFLAMLTKFLGEENTKSGAIGSTHDQFFAENFFNNLLLIDTEGGGGLFKNIELFKSVTAGDLIGIRFPYAESAIYFKPYCKIILSGNTQLRFKEDSAGLRRRLVIIPFLRRWKEGEGDPFLINKITTPECLNALLSISIDYLTSLLNRGTFTRAGKAEELKAEILKNSDPVYCYCMEAEQSFNIKPYGQGITTFYTKFVNYCIKSNIKTDVTRNDFFSRLKVYYPNLQRGRNAQKRIYEASDNIEYSILEYESAPATDASEAIEASAEIQPTVQESAGAIEPTAPAPAPAPAPAEIEATGEAIEASDEIEPTPEELEVLKELKEYEAEEKFKEIEARERFIKENKNINFITSHEESADEIEEADEIQPTGEAIEPTAPAPATAPIIEASALMSDVEMEEMLEEEEARLKAEAEAPAGAPKEQPKIYTMSELNFYSYEFNSWNQYQYRRTFKTSDSYNTIIEQHPEELKAQYSEELIKYVMDNIDMKPLRYVNFNYHRIEAERQRRELERRYKRGKIGMLLFYYCFYIKDTEASARELIREGAKNKRDYIFFNGTNDETLKRYIELYNGNNNIIEI